MIRKLRQWLARRLDPEMAYRADLSYDLERSVRFNLQFQDDLVAGIVRRAATPSPSHTHAGGV